MCPALMKRDSIRIDLSPDYIKRTLDLYEPQHIAIQSAVWCEGALVSQVSPRDYPFTKPGHIDYLTGTMALLYVAQASYLACRIMLTHNLMPSVPPIKDEEFFAARDSGDLVFANASLRFRKKLSIVGAQCMELRLSLDSTKICPRYLFGTVIGRFSGGACCAKGTLGMPLARRSQGAIAP